MRKHFSLQVITVLLLASFLSIALCSCLDESEPLAEGETPLPDMSTSDFTDEDGNVRWPAEILPEDFPEVKEYTRIYSVKRENNEVRVILLAEFNVSEGKMPRVNLCEALLSAGYEQNSIDGDICWGNAAGYYVFVNDTEQVRNPHLESIAKESETGYCYEIVVKKYDVPEATIWKYPAPSVDIGLEKMTYDSFPEEYLPDGIPSPEGLSGLNKARYEQRDNGLFIIIEAPVATHQAYMDLIEDNGVFRFVKENEYGRLYVNDNGDYFYYRSENAYIDEVKIDIDSDKNIGIFQVCPFNEFVETE